MHGQTLQLSQKQLRANQIVSETENKVQTEQVIKENKKQVHMLAGFFPVFIYFTVEFNSFIKQIQIQIIHTLSDAKITFQEVKEQHITLTKTINILQSEVIPLHQKIQKSLKNKLLLPIILLFNKITVLSNFICLQVEKITHLKLQKVTQLIGETIKEPYFKKPIYHLSLLKVKEELNLELKKKIQDTKLSQKTAMLLESLIMSAGIKKIKFHIK